MNNLSKVIIFICGVIILNWFFIAFHLSLISRIVLMIIYIYVMCKELN